MLNHADAEAAGIDPDRFQRILDRIQMLCDDGILPSAGLLVGRDDRTIGPFLFGSQSESATKTPICEDAIFLVASITKPIVAMGLLLLVERGLLTLSDRVTEFIPEFGQQHKYSVTVRHLLTHTSGLPDMLPNNLELREANSPLSAFVDGTCLAELQFPAGRGVKYQSMGFAILGEIIQRVTGISCSQFLKDEFFDPLGMSDTELGAPPEWFANPSPIANRIAEIRIPQTQVDTNWSWNGTYWRSLGAPWGGLLTTPEDLGRFARMMLNAGFASHDSILSPASVQSATRNQLRSMQDVPEVERRCRPWGLGWRLNWAAHSANFGDLLSPETYGHWGATGTVMWIDPATGAFAILLTTMPQEPQGSILAKLSNGIAAAFTR